MHRIIQGVTLSVFASLMVAQTASAGGFAIREQSARGMGVSFAGAAAGGAGLGSMFWNPAIMTQYHGLNTSSSMSLIIPTAKVTTDPTTPTFVFGSQSDVITQGAVVPASYVSYQFNDKLWLGLATNSRFGLVTKYPFNGAWQAAARTSKVFSISFNPTIAYKVNQWLSIGAGLNVEYFKVRLTSAIANPPAAAVLPGAGTLELKGDSWAIGYTLGVTLTPMEGTTIGIGYRSRMRQSLEGGVTNFPFIPTGATNIRSNIVLPDQITVGLRQRISPVFTLLAGVEWTNWSVFNSFPVTSTGPIFPGAVLAPLTLSFRWRDGWMASVGGEYKWNDKLTVRSGIGYEWSPVTNATRGLRLPDQNRLWLSAGLTYQWSENLSLDASYTHLYIPAATLNVTAANPTFTGINFFGTARAHFDIVSVGVNYRFGHKARAVVAKY